MSWLLVAWHAVLGLAFAFALWRLVRGPALADRVVALDVMAGLAVGFLVLRAVSTGLWLYVDVALGIGLISAVGTIAFGAFIERRTAECRAEER